MDKEDSAATGLVTPPAERLLVCVSSGASAAELITSARNMAAGLHAKWFAVYVEEPRMMLSPEAERNRAVDNLRFAEESGAETFTLHGRNVAAEIIKFARRHGVTRIIAGKPKKSRWHSILLRNPAAQLVLQSGAIDVYVISGEPVEPREARYTMRPEEISWPDYGSGLLFFILANALCFSMYPYFHLSNLIMMYLLGVVVTAAECGRGPAILVSFLSVLAFDVFSVPPRWSLTVEDSQYIVTFSVMLLIALVISHLTSRLRQQAAIAHRQERQAAAMHGLSRQLASTRGVDKILQAAVLYIGEIFDCRPVALLPDAKDQLQVAAGDLSAVFKKDVVREVNAARAAYNTGRMAGLGTQLLPSAEILYVPLQAADTRLGVLAVRPRDPDRFRLAEQLQLLESLTKQVALALEVERLTVSGSSRQAQTGHGATSCSGDRRLAPDSPITG